MNMGLTTDQGSECKNQLNDEMMKILNIRHHPITAYHRLHHRYVEVGSGESKSWPEECNN